MAVAPTLAFSAANAATGIASSVLVGPTVGGVIPVAGSPYRYNSSLWQVFGGNNAYTQIKPISTNAQPGQGQVEFWSDADKLEIVLKGGGNTCRVMIDGKLPTFVPQAIPGDGSDYRLLLDFTTAGGAIGRHFSLWGTGLYFRGVQQLSRFGLTVPPRPRGLRCVVAGDSYVSANGAQNDAFSVRMARRLGFSDSVMLGVPSSGYVALGNSVNYGHVTRLADVVQYAPDLVVVYGTINDNNLAGVGVAAAAYFAALRSALPSTVIVVVGPVDHNGASTASLISTVRDPVRVAALAAGFSFVDPLTILTGTGNAGAPNGTGNRDRYLSSDGVHPTTEGHEYIAQRITAEIEPLLQAKFS